MGGYTWQTALFLLVLNACLPFLLLRHSAKMSTDLKVVLLESLAWRLKVYTYITENSELKTTIIFITLKFSLITVRIHRYVLFIDNWCICYLIFCSVTTVILNFYFHMSVLSKYLKWQYNSNSHFLSCRAEHYAKHFAFSHFILTAALWVRCYCYLYFPVWGNRGTLRLCSLPKVNVLSSEAGFRPRCGWLTR